ncbi:gp53-like domain-containing protein [Azospirillum brasilense]|uniref:gp53-like domain-containing protein n=1 Tax=Azospirillum brasilense TaxID=192 RepID=UPI001586E0B0|nr:hypothetical protein [Azospirillum brasilense]
MSLGSRVRQSIQGAGPTSFALVDDASATQSRTIVTAYGSGPTRAGIFTIIDQAAAQWAVVEGYATAGSGDTFTVTRTIRNSQGNANNLTWSTTNAKTIFVGDCADLLALQCQCPVSTGSAWAYAIALTPAPLALVTNSLIRFYAHAANAGACTLAVNGLPAWPIRRADGAALVAGQLAQGIVEVLADPANSRFLLVSAPGLPASSWAFVGLNPGMHRDPTGQIVKWGTAQTNSSGYATVTFQEAFPVEQLHNGATLFTLTAVPSAFIIGSDGGSQTQLTVTATTTSGAPVAVNVKWMAIGK